MALQRRRVHHTVKLDVQTVATKNTVEERYFSSHGGRESGLFPAMMSVVLEVKKPGRSLDGVAEEKCRDSVLGMWRSRHARLNASLYGS